MSSYIWPGSQPAAGCPLARDPQNTPASTDLDDGEERDDAICRNDADDAPPTLLDSALALAASGLPVFPCNSLKRPCIAGGHGYQDASVDPDRIRELWDLAGPAAQLIGVPTGGASGFDVLDFDPRHGSDNWRVQNIHRLPETRVHGTPGLPKGPTDPTMPGEHWLFRHVDGVRNIQDGQSIAPGIDVRGSGGYIIMPPSTGYAVIHKADIAPWPDWLLPLVIKAAELPPRPDPSSYATPAKVTENRLRGFIDREVRRVRDAPQGGRHNARLAAARSIGGVAVEAGLSDTEVEEMLIAARPPEVEEEKERKTIRAGLAYGRAAPIDLNKLPDSAQFRGYQHRGNGAAAPESDAQEAPLSDADVATDTDDSVPPGWVDARPLAEGDIAVPGDPLLTEQVAMEAFIAGFHTDLRFNHSSNSWLVWANHHWNPDQRKLAFAWALKLCKQLAHTSTAKGRLVVEKVRFSAAVEQGARAMPPISTAQEDWDASPMLLGTPGGVVDLKTGELRGGERFDMITKTTAVTPAETPGCPTWDAFLNFAMGGDDQRIRFIQRFCGYCLTGLTIEEILLFLFGIAGSGKSTLVETLCGIMGDYASAAPMEVFTGASWSPTEYYRANMAGRRLIVAAEPERGAFWAEAFVKSITGGDKMSGRHPAGRPFDFEPTHKPLLHGNHMPRLRGRSTAMERRLLILLFSHKPETPDRTLKAKLRSEWPGILRWMIEGCLTWQRIGLQPPDAIRAANTSYFEAQNVFGRWIEDYCTLDKIAELPPSILRTSFNRWARANGEEELSSNAFAEAIDQFETIPPLTRGRANGKRFVKGIRLNPWPTEEE